MDVLIGLVGAFVVLVAAADVFGAVIVPRPVTLVRPSGLFTRYSWRACTRFAQRLASVDRRESLLGVFAPATLVSSMILWILLLVFGFGAIFYALRTELRPEPANFWVAVYYAGTSLLTLGYGDIVASSGLTRALSLITAALGLGTFAVVITFLFSLFGAFQRREAFIVTLRERTGAPPSGVQLLITHAQLGMLDDIAPIFQRAELWMAELMETHLAYPMLVYFRSTHDEQSWVGTLGALLDASSLLITTLELEPRGPARMLNKLGRHVVGDFSRFYRIPGTAQPGIERSEFARAYAELRAAGLPLRDENTAWPEFAALRASYAGPLNALAGYLQIPPALWVGDRSLIQPLHAPVRIPVLAVTERASEDAPPGTV